MYADLRGTSAVRSQTSKHPENKKKKSNETNNSSISDRFTLLAPTAMPLSPSPNSIPGECHLPSKRQGPARVSPCIAAGIGVF